MLRYYSYVIICWKPLFNVFDVLLHAVPAYAMDFIAFVMGKKRKYDIHFDKINNVHISIFFLWHIVYFFFISRYRNAKNYQKLNRVLSMMSFFGLREWKFCNKNIDQLATLLKSQSKQTLTMHGDSTGSSRWKNGVSYTQSNGMASGCNTTDDKSNQKSQTCLEFDMRTIDWDEYFFHYLPGIKKYFFKESVSDSKKSIRHYRRFVLLNLIVL